MRNDINIICRTSAAFLALLFLASCASTDEAPPPPPPLPVEPAPPAPVEAPPVQIKPAAPLKYVVQKGDTLWDISQKFLRDAWQWPEVWYVNEQVANPHLIYPGDVLYLTWVDGQPRVAREGDPAPAPVVATRGTDDRLKPRIRELPIDSAISAIPRELIAGFLRGPRIVGDDDIFDDAPYILDFDDPRLMNAAEATAYVLDVEDTSVLRYQLVRQGKRYVDPDDGDTIGYEAIPVGEVEVTKFGEPSTIRITRSDIEARVGDRLLPLDPADLDAHFYPHSPSKRVDGKIIDVFNGDTQIGQYQIVAINRGSSHGIENGHVLSIMQAGRKAVDPHSFFGTRVQLPAVNAGTVMVFKTADRMSVALVMTALRQIHVGDKVEKPEASR